MTSTDRPLGSPTTAADLPAEGIDLGSIVDTILNLDQLMSADVRRAKKTARFYTRADLEGSIDELEAQLDAVTDAQGNLIGGLTGDGELGGATHPAVALARKITELRREYAASRVGIEVQQMPSTDWDAFQERHKTILAGDTPYSNVMWDDLIARSLIPVSTPEKVAALRSKFGHPQVDEIAATAWTVNATSGVSVPKSPRSSVVLRRAQLERS